MWSVRPLPQKSDNKVKLEQFNDGEPKSSVDTETQTTNPDCSEQDKFAYGIAFPIPSSRALNLNLSDIFSMRSTNQICTLNQFLVWPKMTGSLFVGAFFVGDILISFVFSFTHVRVSRVRNLRLTSNL